MTCAYCGSAIVGLRPRCLQCGGPVGESRLKVRWGWTDPDAEAKYEETMTRYVMAWKNDLPLLEFNYLQLFDGGR